jgi:hypothetical protein
MPQLCQNLAINKKIKQMSRKKLEGWGKTETLSVKCYRCLCFSRNMLVVVDEDDELFASGALCFTVEGGRRAMVSWLAGGYSHWQVQARRAGGLIGFGVSAAGTHGAAGIVTHAGEAVAALLQRRRQKISNQVKPRKTPRVRKKRRRSCIRFVQPPKSSKWIFPLRRRDRRAWSASPGS